MKRKVDWDEKEESDYEDSNASGNEESDNEEPRIKEVLEGLSQLVSRQKASDLLHSMAASKDILFWTPRGQLLRNQRIIPVTNISEGGTVASWLARSTPERALRVRALAGDIVLCSWARHFTLTVPLSTQVYKWVPANLMLGGNPAMD